MCLIGGLGSRTRSNWLRGQFALAIGAILLVQLVYWLLLRPILFAPPLDFERLKPEMPAIATIGGPTLADVRGARFKPVTLPAEDCCGPGYRALSFRITLDAVPEQGLGIVTQANADNVWLAVNGQWANRPGRMELGNLTYHGNIKQILHIAPGLLKVGANEFMVVSARDGVPWFDFVPPLIARHDVLVASTRQISFLRNEYKTISTTIAAIMAVLALALALSLRGSAFAFWIAVLFAAWGLRTGYYLWVDPPFAGTDRLMWYFALTILVPVAWLQSANEWTGKPWRWLRWFGLALGLAMAIWVAWQLSTNMPDGYDRAGEAIDLGGTALGVLAVLRFLWHLATQPEQRHWEAALLALGATVSTINFLQFYLAVPLVDNLDSILPLLAIGFAVAFFERNIRLFRSADDLNALLSNQLREREAELAAEYSRQEELARRETLVSERQRLMRDMHDGIGGQLMSLLFAARQKTIPRAELTEGLQAVIDELRLIIDSLDTVGESLGAALASFRSRIEPRLGAAGIRIEWTNRLPDDLPGLSPRAILQVFRIVQEAITNAIKHSGSKAIAIELELAPDDPSRLLVRVADQGKGISKGEANLAGRGIESMRARATAIGGTLDLTSDTAGTTVTLGVPLEPAVA